MHHTYFRDKDSFIRLIQWISRVSIDTSRDGESEPLPWLGDEGQFKEAGWRGLVANQESQRVRTCLQETNGLLMASCAHILIIHLEIRSQSILLTQSAYTRTILHWILTIFGFRRTHHAYHWSSARKKQTLFHIILSTLLKKHMTFHTREQTLHILRSTKYM